MVAAVAVAFGFAVPAGQAGMALREIGLALAAATVVASLLLRAPVARRLAVAAALVLVTGAELIWRNAGSALNAEPAERYAVFQQLPPEQLQGLTLLKRELAERHARGERPRVEILGLGGAWQNASMVLGLEDTIGYNPLRLADYERAVGPGENAVDPNLRQFPGTFRGYRCRLASLLGLEYLVLDRALDKLPRHFPRLVGAKLLYGSGAMWIYRLSPGTPRAQFVSRLIPVDSDSVLAEAELPEFDRAEEAMIDRSSLGEIEGDYVGRPAATLGRPVPVRVVEYGGNAVTLEVESDRSGVVVLHDIHYPGWEVTVDGERKPMLRANLLFRGVEVGAGRHRIEFRFRPLSVDNLVAAASGLIDEEVDEAAGAVVR